MFSSLFILYILCVIATTPVEHVQTHTKMHLSRRPVSSSGAQSKYALFIWLSRQVDSRRMLDPRRYTYKEGTKTSGHSFPEEVPAHHLLGFHLDCLTTGRSKSKAKHCEEKHGSLQRKYKWSAFWTRRKLGSILTCQNRPAAITACTEAY